MEDDMEEVKWWRGGLLLDRWWWWWNLELLGEIIEPFRMAVVDGGWRGTAYGLAAGEP